MTVEGEIIKAKKGCVLRRISDGYIPGPEISLGYTYYLNGKKLEEPLLELPEHFEEIPMPADMLEQYEQVWAQEELEQLNNIENEQ